MSPSQNNDSPQSLGGSIPPDGGFKIAADLDSVQTPYIGEDGRLTLLRQIDTMFRSMAGNSSGSSASISQETLRLLPSITRTLIQFVGELQANNSQLHMSYARLQAAQENLQARERHIEARISSLQRKNESLKDTNMKLEFQYHDIKRDISEVERSYANIKAQKDILMAELDEIKLGATSDSASKKRSRQE
ncbi:hypothetical protein B0J14DRAFT_114231 [Halenospora varia]|nr:hypothetical protein B0J14DRAFT_114231 [Halenospora varia]